MPPSSSIQIPTSPVSCRLVSSAITLTSTGNERKFITRCRARAVRTIFLFRIISWVSLKADRSRLPEYARFAGLACEVQVQTTLNHAWSEMVHDILYKKPKLAGFGGKLFEAMEQRFQRIMKTYLLPAGYEFQKALDDYERLISGKQLFDRGALKLSGNATTMILVSNCSNASATIRCRTTIIPSAVSRNQRNSHSRRCENRGRPSNR